MRNELIEIRIINALESQEPKKPRVCELGGGIYYKCHWLTCNNDLHRYQNYCDKCGQRIGWEYL